MLILLGKTSSGKDAVKNKLVKDYGFRPIVTYTTRPMRPKETDGITYHFISEEDFKAKIEDGFFLEYKKYHTEQGIWYYGSSWQDYERSDDKTVIILTPSGYEDFLRELPDVKHTSIYLYANNTTIKNRLIKRGDSKDEAERRLKSDNRDFKDAQALAQKIVYNNAGARLEDVCNKILEYMETNN